MIFIVYQYFRNEYIKYENTFNVGSIQLDKSKEKINNDPFDLNCIFIKRTADCDGFGFRFFKKLQLIQET